MLNEFGNREITDSYTRFPPPDQPTKKDHFAPVGAFGLFPASGGGLPTNESADYADGAD